MKVEQEFLTEPKQIKSWLEAMGISGCKINGDGLVDVNGDVNLERKLGSLTRLPVRFRKVTGSFWCYSNQLASLEGGPKEVGGDFYCDYNQLVSLEGAPKAVRESFSCRSNQLVSLEGWPKVGGRFHCRGNHIATLIGVPQSIQDKILDMDDIKAKDKLMLTEKPAVMEALRQVQGEDIGEYCDVDIGLA